MWQQLSPCKACKGKSFTSANSTPFIEERKSKTASLRKNYKNIFGRQFSNATANEKTPKGVLKKV